MIARDSKSYPYLAIAQHYGVDYEEVLKYSNMIDNAYSPPYTDWKFEVWRLEMDKLHCNIK